MSINEKIVELRNFVPNDQIRNIVINIVVSLSELPPDNAKFLSFNSFKNLIENDVSDGDLIVILSILTSNKINILRPFFVYHNSDEDENILSPEELSEARDSGYLINPISGMRDDNFLEKTFPYFCITTEFQNLVAPK